jgi:hypothetical protein
LRVFLSYHTPDRPLAFALKAAIENALPGSNVFLDQTHLKFGHFWQPGLFQAIAECKVFLILVSNHLGDWQKVEYYEAQNRKVRDDSFILLPIIIADRTKGPAANLPGLSQLQWVENTDRLHRSRSVRSSPSFWAPKFQADRTLAYDQSLSRPVGAGSDHQELCRSTKRHVNPFAVTVGALVGACFPLGLGWCHHNDSHFLRAL